MRRSVHRPHLLAKVKECQLRVGILPACIAVNCTRKNLFTNTSVITVGITQTDANAALARRGAPYAERPITPRVCGHTWRRNIR